MQITAMNLAFLFLRRGLEALPDGQRDWPGNQPPARRRGGAGTS